MFAKDDIYEISNNLMNLAFLLNTRIFNPNQMSKEMCIPHSHMKVLFHLIKRGSCPVSKIANDLIISKSNMTPIIDNLIADGYVNRINSPADRRVILIEATEKAHAFLEDHKQKLSRSLAEKISMLNDEDLTALKNLSPQLASLISKI